MGDMIEVRFDGKIKPQSLTNVLIEAKIDGARHEWDGKNIISDRGIVRNDRYPHIVKDLLTLGIKGRGEIAIPFGNVLVLNAKENWHKARFYLFDMYEHNGQDTRNANALENRHLLEKTLGMGTINHIGCPNLRIPFKFKDFQTGWNHVLKHDLEGLVMKDIGSSRQYKIKYRKEEKLPIVGFIPGAVKGCFQIERKGVVGGLSALSTAFVQQYNDMLAKGLQPYAEIEYLFLTDNGIPFQPRLRRLGTLQDLAVT